MASAITETEQAQAKWLPPRDPWDFNYLYPICEGCGIRRFDVNARDKPPDFRRRADGAPLCGDCHKKDFDSYQTPEYFVLAKIENAAFNEWARHTESDEWNGKWEGPIYAKYKRAQANRYAARDNADPKIARGLAQDADYEELRADPVRWAEHERKRKEREYDAYVKRMIFWEVDARERIEARDRADHAERLAQGLDYICYFCRANFGLNRRRGYSTYKGDFFCDNCSREIATNPSYRLPYEWQRGKPVRVKNGLLDHWEIRPAPQNDIAQRLDIKDRYLSAVSRWINAGRRDRAIASRASEIIKFERDVIDEKRKVAQAPHDVHADVVQFFLYHMAQAASCGIEDSKWWTGASLTLTDEEDDITCVECVKKIRWSRDPLNPFNARIPQTTRAVAAFTPRNEGMPPDRSRIRKATKKYRKLGLM